jgi:hypothetical protein
MHINPPDYAHGQRFLHGPDWRCHVAETWLAKPQQSGPPTDLDVQAWCAFLRLHRGGPQDRARALQEHAHLAAALELTEEIAIANRLKVLVLADCTPAQICKRLSMDAQVLDAWEKIFFDVRSVRTAMDWIVSKVIKPVEEQGDASLVVKLKLACIGGPLAALAALEAESRVLTRTGPTLFDLKVCLYSKCEQAFELSLDTAEQRRFFIKTHADLMHQEKQLQLAERKLAHQSQKALRRHELALAKLEQRRQRAAERAAQATHKNADKAAKQKRVRTSKRKLQGEGLPLVEALPTEKQGMPFVTVVSKGSPPLQSAERCQGENQSKPWQENHQQEMPGPRHGSKNHEHGKGPQLARKAKSRTTDRPIALLRE